MNIKRKEVATHLSPNENKESSPIILAPNEIVKLLTFNIQVGNSTSHYHHYFTRSWQHILPYKDRIKNLQRIADLIKQYDFVALQEVDGGSLRSSGINQTEFLAKLANFPYWHQQTNRNLGKLAQHSNGMLTRFKPNVIEDHPLPGMRGRGAIFSRFGEGENSLIIVVMHLALSKKARKEQLDYIYKMIAPYKYHILMGDMNAETFELVDNSALQKLDLVLPQNTATYPSWNPKRCLDHILLSKGLTVENINVLQQPISDHLPIEVSIKLPEVLLSNINQSLYNL
ncbi:endonuclease [Gammaproteobacteria bacterium ESL0073]|nr:endonuclease [Gammaproteobacteria bacterium ESL0073]